MATVVLQPISPSFQFKLPTVIAPDLRGGRRRSSVRVFSSRIKDLEPWLLKLPTKLEVEEEEKHVNMGFAIRTLREDFPELFYRDLTFHIYRDDIVFKDPLNCFVGIENYKTILWALRLSGRILFKALWVDIISVWQPVESTIMIRWVVHGTPRVPWERRARFDATSEYKLDKRGKIYEHRVHNIALNAPPRFQVLSLNHELVILGCPKATYYHSAAAAAAEPERLTD